MGKAWHGLSMDQGTKSCPHRGDEASVSSRAGGGTGTGRLAQGPPHPAPAPPQSRSDFIGGRVALALSLPTQEECLSLALLDMLRIAREQGQSPQQVCSLLR